jgi:hypothetical protein
LIERELPYLSRNETYALRGFAGVSSIGGLAGGFNVVATERRIARQMTRNRIHWTCRICDADSLDSPEAELGPCCAGCERLRAAPNFSRSTMSRRSSTIRSLTEDLCQSLRRLDAVEFEEKCIAAWGRFAVGNA